MSTVTNYMLGSTQVINIYYGQTLVWPLTQEDDYFYIETAHNSIGVDDYIYVPVLCSRMENDSSSNIHYPQTLYYSYDQINWNVADIAVEGPHDNAYNIGTWDDSSTGWSYSYERANYKILATSHDKIYLKGNLSPWVHGDNPYATPQYKDFTRSIISGLHSEYLDIQNSTRYGNNFSVGGNICSLLYGDITHHEIPNDYTYVFSVLFGDIGSWGHYLQDISNLILPNNVTAYCYDRIFNGSQITTSPLLPASTLAQGCYYMMFLDCSNLSNIKCLATDISANLCTYRWVDSVSGTGTFNKATSMYSWSIGSSGIPTGWNVQNYRPISHDYSQDYLTFETLEDGVSITWNDTSNSNSISYSANGGNTWNTLSSGSGIGIGTAGTKILFKASGLSIANMYGIGTFGTSGRCNIMGNVMSLVYGDNFVNQTTMSNYQFRRLFENCSNIVDASNLILPSTTATYSCYNTMFKNCTSLVAAPELPATTLANYCYSNIFNGCTSLTTAPALPAVTLSDSCYSNMFNGCTSLTIAPVLQATTLVYGCYNSMFRNCSSLVSAPELPAATLAQECYYYMFNGCTSLNYIKCLATNISATNCTKSWVVDVAASGTFVKVLGYAGWQSAGTSGNGIPSGWTVQNAS